MSYYLTTQYFACSPQSQEIRCMHRDRHSFNYGFMPDVILALQKRNKNKNKKRVHKLSCYYTPGGHDSTLLVKIQNKNIMALFVDSFPIASSIKQFYIRPRYMIIGCVTGPKHLTIKRYFHQQFIFKICYRHSDVLILLQVVGDDTAAMHHTIVVNGYKVQLTETTSSHYCTEYVLGNDECIEHFSHMRSFLQLFHNNDGSAKNSFVICFTFQWPWKRPKVRWDPVEYKVAIKDDLFHCSENSPKSKLIVDSLDTSDKSLANQTAIRETVSNEIHETIIATNAVDSQPPKKKMKLT